RRNATPEPMPTIPVHSDCFHYWTNDSLGQFVAVQRLSVSEVKNHSRFGIAHRTAICIQDVSQLPDHRNRRGAGTRLCMPAQLMPNCALEGVTEQRQENSPALKLDTPTRCAHIPDTKFNLEPC